MDTSVSGEIQHGQEVPAETSTASEKSDVQNAGIVGTEDGSPPSTNAIEREAESVPEEGSQLHFRTTHVTESANEEFEMSNVTSSVSILRSDSWASREVSATLPPNARIVYSPNETEVSIKSIQCEMQSNKNNSQFSPVIVDATVDTSDVSATSKTVAFSEGNQTGVTEPEEKNVDFRTKETESHEIKSDAPTDTESNAAPNISPTSSSKVQAFKAFFDGKASAENTKTLVIVDTSVKSIPDEGVSIENVSNDDKNSMTKNSNEEKDTVSEDIPKPGHSSAYEVIKEIESIDSKQLSAEKSEDLKNENDEKGASSDDKNEVSKESFTVPSALKSKEKQSNLKNESSLVLPLITITEVDDVLDDSEDDCEGSDEIMSAETEQKVSTEIEKVENEDNFSEIKAGENFKDLQSVSNEVERSELLEDVKTEVKEDLRSLGNEEIAGANDDGMTSDIPSDSKQLVSTEENLESNKGQTADSAPCSSAVLSDDSEVSDEPEQVEERKAFFYISSSEIQPGRLEKAFGYTNLAFEDSEGSSERQREHSLGASSSPSENHRSGPSECLGSTSLHAGIIMLSIFVVYIGYCLYSLAHQKRVPYIYETVGLSTSAIAGGVALFSSLYLGVQWCGRNYQSAGYAPLENCETTSLINRVRDPYPYTMETGFVDIERAGRHDEERDNVLKRYQDQPSTSGLSASTQKLKTEVTGLLESLGNVISKKTLQDSAADVDFTREEAEKTFYSSQDSSEHSVYASAELPLDSKEDSAEQNKPTKRD